MNWLDIVIIIILILAAWQGYKQGVIVQVLGLVAIIAGIFLARNYGTLIGTSLGLAGTTANIAGFSIVLVGVILVVVLIGRLTRGLFHIVGLGIFDNIFGVVFSVLKVYIIVYLILQLFGIDSIFNNALWIRNLWQ